MPITAIIRINATKPILDGVTVILPIGTPPINLDNFTKTDRAYVIPSGDALQFYQTLDSRFDTPPSGWNHP